jgi:hypothetical protein
MTWRLMTWCLMTYSEREARDARPPARLAAACALLAIHGLAAACGRAPQPAADWAPRVERIESPAGPASAQPQLTTSSDAVILSWLENAGSQSRFRFAQRTATGWSEARTIASAPDFFANFADVPSVMRMSDRTLVAHWLRRNSSQTGGYDLQIASSGDEGRSWSQAFSPHHDGTKTQHGFASLFELHGGSTPFGLVWLDGRATTPAANPDDDATGEMTLRSARYDSAWREQTDEAIALRVCDCCPTASAVTADGVVVAYRSRSADEIRDIYVSRLVDGRWTTPASVHDDGWRIDGCPVNGPSLSASGREVAVAWFSAPHDEGHAYVAFSRDSGRTFESPIRVDDAGSLGRVDVELTPDGSAIVSWIELANRRAALMARRIGRGGDRSSAVTVADVTANRGTSYPRMARRDREIVFAWTGGEDVRVQTAVAPIP